MTTTITTTMARMTTARTTTQYNRRRRRRQQRGRGRHRRRDDKAVVVAEPLGGGAHFQRVALAPPRGPQHLDHGHESAPLRVPVAHDDVHDGHEPAGAIRLGMRHIAGVAPFPRLLPALSAPDQACPSGTRPATNRCGALRHPTPSQLQHTAGTTRHRHWWTLVHTKMGGGSMTMR